MQCGACAVVRVRAKKWQKRGRCLTTKGGGYGRNGRGSSKKLEMRHGQAFVWEGGARTAGDEIVFFRRG